jgi:hypothetical protein
MDAKSSTLINTVEAVITLDSLRPANVDVPFKLLSSLGPSADQLRRTLMTQKIVQSKDFDPERVAGASRFLTSICSTFEKQFRLVISFGCSGHPLRVKVDGSCLRLCSR